ncbi:MAG TPA: ferrochelatase [Methylomirabilota bacterium]|nr:ferrochelatase [Methylomirabilota bacterium]
MNKFDALLLIAFGGPTRPEEIRSFLANVTRGLPIPPERIEAVTQHYELIGGRSPLNELTFRQAEALRALLKREGIKLPVYVGMRNWSPYLADALARMAADGVTRALGVILSSFQCEASWERYQRAVALAQERVGNAPVVEYVAPWFDHPLFVAGVADRVTLAMRDVPDELRSRALLIFTAHSIPVPMANASPYVAQLTTSSRLVAEKIGHARWLVAYQSRSGNPREPWLEPDINDAIRIGASEGVQHVVVSPIGFVCDHVEVLYDLDVQARATAEKIGLAFHRASAINDHPEFIRMLAEVATARLAA